MQVKAEGDLTFHEMLDGLAILLGGAAIQKFELYFLMYHHVRFMTHPLNSPTVLKSFSEKQSVQAKQMVVGRWTRGVSARVRLWTG